MFIVLVFAVVIFSPAAVNENRINPKVKIQLLEDQAQNYYLQGEMDNGTPFKINLEYEDQYILNNVKFIDLTGDGKSELCVGLQFANNIVSDFNAIHVYDTRSLKQLFPIQEDVYNSQIIPLNDALFPEHGLEYQDYDKAQSVIIDGEHSIRGWIDGSFEIKEYKEKLLSGNDHVGVYLDDYSPFEKEPSIKLTVYQFQDFYKVKPGEFQKKIQDITINIKDATKSPVEIIHNIENGNFVKLEDINNDGFEDIDIRLDAFYDKAEDIIYYWDRKQNLFKQNDLD